MGKFHQKVVVINGGTKGVGFGVAEAIAKEGGTVIISGRSKESGEACMQKLRDKYQAEGAFILNDLSDCDSCENLIYQTKEMYGKVDAYLHYAGVTPTGKLTEITKDDFDFAFERNIRGAMFGCKAAVKVMEEQGYGSIVLVGSAHGLGGGEIDRVIYGATKGALLTLMKHISNRYADKGIRANYITMGWVATESEIELRRSQNHPDDWLERKGAEVIPLGRLVTVDDMVPGIVYLLGDDSQMVTGTALHITGGMTYI